MKHIQLKNIVWKEGGVYISWNLNTGVSSFGSTKKSALLALNEALELHLEDVPLESVSKVSRIVVEDALFRHA